MRRAAPRDAVDGQAVLALNCGSSSIKFGLYRTTGGEASALHDGSIDDVRLPAEAILARIEDALAARSLPMPAAIGHRMVHGGPDLRQHALVDAEVRRQLHAAAAFAPLHMPPALALLRVAEQRYPGRPQVACLDTAFHAGMPKPARTLPLPAEIRRLGVERYGFHGLSCESIMQQLGSAPARLVIAHLGHGASVTAVASGRSVDTSMGLTPSGGIMMTTRCGDIDPGVLTYLLREHGYDASRLDDLVNLRSGMAGVSVAGDDFPRLSTLAATDDDARLAIDMFCHSTRKQLAAMIAVLGGVDMLVFTGGIGANSEQVRRRTSAGLAPAPAVRAMRTREEQCMARHVARLAFGART